MSARARQRAARREALQLQCSRQREQLADALTAVQRHLEPLDRTLATLRTLRRTPLVAGGLAALASATAALLFAGRTRRPRLGRFSWLLPLATPLFRLVELWWQQRRSAAAHPVSESHPESPRPHHP